jgi:hypothetical protein
MDVFSVELLKDFGYSVVCGNAALTLELII